MAHWHSCNILQIGADVRQLWQFSARDGGFVLNREQASPAGHPLPAGLAAKGWRELFQRKLNVAWLPPEKVFLRVAQFPQSNLDETLAMVELQLEKLSPIPVTQVVWSVHLLPHAAGNLQTVIVILAERKAVEEFLGQLEGHGYLADRLEVPALDQLQATAIKGDGAWIYPAACGGENTALVAWWYGGVLQNLNFITLPANGDHATALREQLAQTAWASEMEGWLTAPPAWHLVAEPAAATLWESALRQGLNEPVAVSAPVTGQALAALTARRAAQSERGTGLLPAEFADRYRQQYYDRLWMRGLAAVGGVYLLAVMIYFGAVQFLAYETRGVEDQVKALGPAYTNAMQLKARLDVLNQRHELKYAGLDCLYVVAEKLPERFRLDNVSFRDGKKLMLAGSAPGDQLDELYAFHDKMRKALVNGQSLFDIATSATVPHWTRNPAGTEMSWDFALELKRTEAQ